MTKGERYMHERAMDCFVELLLHPLELEDGRLLLTVRWWNKGQMGTPYALGITQTFKLTPEQIKEWKLV